ncbi:hypothetical protein [Haloarcula marina]|uniref:hypothetical protein n=1 Tax=Haloarcula marina TaxID=2961574 RepID=UPI0020B7E52B|nr:hypothetical protein [Halomicroarcula marina]
MFDSAAVAASDDSAPRLVSADHRERNTTTHCADMLWRWSHSQVGRFRVTTANGRIDDDSEPLDTRRDGDDPMI